MRSVQPVFRLPHLAYGLHAVCAAKLVPRRHEQVDNTPWFEDALQVGASSELKSNRSHLALSQLRATILRVRASLRLRFDFFLFTSDSTFIAVPTLRAYLAEVVSMQATPAERPTLLNAALTATVGDMMAHALSALSQPLNASLFIGRRFALDGDQERWFNSASAGILLNRRALELVYMSRNVQRCSADAEGPGDVILSECLVMNRVVPLDTRDAAGGVTCCMLCTITQREPSMHPPMPTAHSQNTIRLAHDSRSVARRQERFNTFHPQTHISYRRHEHDWYSRFSPFLLDGIDGCSRRAVSFSALNVAALSEVDRLVRQSLCS